MTTELHVFISKLVRKTVSTNQSDRIINKEQYHEEQKGGNSGPAKEKNGTCSETEEE